VNILELREIEQTIARPVGRDWAANRLQLGVDNEASADLLRQQIEGADLEIRTTADQAGRMLPTAIAMTSRRESTYPC
jgi:hypothetical protein